MDSEKKLISGKNTIRFKMLEDMRIQPDLFASLKVDKILYSTIELKYSLELGKVFIGFPAPLKAAA